MGDALEKNNSPLVIDKIPPQNLDAERACLGSMLLDREAIEIAIDTLKEDDFYSAQHRIVFKAVLELYNQAIPVDIITLNNYLKNSNELEKVGGVVYVSSLLDEVPTSANIEYYAKISGTEVKEFGETSAKLGQFCGKPFKISVLGIRK